MAFFAKKRVKQIKAAQFHSMALTTDNELYTWGLGADGRLGNGQVDIKGDPQMVLFVSESGSSRRSSGRIDSSEESHTSLEQELLKNMGSVSGSNNTL